MSRKHKDKNRRKEKSEEKKNSDFFESRLHPETKKSVWAIIFLGVSIILLLAKFQNAGPAGNLFYDIFESLFGWGYYLLPLIFLIMAGVFLSSERRKIYGITFIGAVLFVLAGLGLIDLIFPPEGGFIGKAVGFLEKFFGYVASIIILILVSLASLLVILNLPIKIRQLIDFFGSFKNAESDDLAIEETQEAINEELEEELEAGEIEEVEGKELSLKEAAINYGKDMVSAIGLKKDVRQTVLSSQGPKVDYIAPPLDLLRSSVEKPTVGDLRASANIIKRTLEGFGIPVEMGEINIGPKVTRYTLKPAEGVKLSRITALSQDLSLALAAHPIRIEAPIPGKSLVGIEVPNKVTAIVRLGSLMHYPDFNTSGLLGFVLGRDVTGEPIFVDIEKMPHMLIAGATGSGKSIALHTLIISLLYKNSPQTLKLILIDPKRVELSIYDKLPHLVSPVITDAKKTIGVFRWAIDEMDRRYDLLLAAGSRDIQSYNKKNPNDCLPYLLMVIDELADLMATYGREIEGSIVRLAQMARATGLHLVVSTQRPSVEVITGLIKANITTRVALQVASQVDSRTILDLSGAEKLLGGGDMLFVSTDLSKPKRIQGAYISEEEINKVVNFIRENNKSIIPEETPIFENNNGTGASQDIFSDYSDLENDDDLYEQAIDVVKEAQKASASLLQRRLKVGYARAARLLDMMEAKGIIGPGDGAKPRDVYIKRVND
ncbi:MAG: DNA translocase FtsK 4TM domain-containing protein [Patescibacteria group bacterium]